MPIPWPQEVKWMFYFLMATPVRLHLGIFQLNRMDVKESFKHIRTYASEERLQMNSQMEKSTDGKDAILYLLLTDSGGTEGGGTSPNTPAPGDDSPPDAIPQKHYIFHIAPYHDILHVSPSPDVDHKSATPRPLCCCSYRLTYRFIVPGPILRNH
ncbi:hypothetical protein AKJ16_DCAP14252 [Drosera capensis]